MSLSLKIEHEQISVSVLIELLVKWLRVLPCITKGDIYKLLILSKLAFPHPLPCHISYLLRGNMKSMTVFYFEFLTYNTLYLDVKIIKVGKNQNIGTLRAIEASKPHL